MPASSRLTLAPCQVCRAPAPFRGEKSSYRFHRCDKCGLLFVWPMPVDNLAIYSEDYFAGAREGFGYVDYDHDKATMQPTFERYLDLLSQGAAGRRRLLDVGAATGFFLEIARRRDWSVTGVEPSAFAAGLARNKGLDVRHGVVEELDAPDGSFDVVTMWDVLEHVRQPRASLAAAFRLLRPGGLLALNTPDAGSLLARLLGLRWHLVVPPEHLVLFHQQSLRLLLSDTGFQVDAMRRIGKRFTVQYVLQTLARWQGLSVWQRAAEIARKSGFGEWGLSINLRDNVFVLARNTPATGSEERAHRLRTIFTSQRSGCQCQKHRWPELLDAGGNQSAHYRPATAQGGWCEGIT